MRFKILIIQMYLSNGLCQKISIFEVWDLDLHFLYNYCFILMLINSGNVKRFSKLAPLQNSKLDGLLNINLSYIRHKDFCSSSVLFRDAQTTPLKSATDGLESSGWQLISSIGKTKRIAFFVLWRRKKYIFKIFISF